MSCQRGTQGAQKAIGGMMEGLLLPRPLKDFDRYDRIRA